METPRKPPRKPHLVNLPCKSRCEKIILGHLKDRRTDRQENCRWPRLCSVVNGWMARRIGRQKFFMYKIFIIPTHAMRIVAIRCSASTRATAGHDTWYPKYRHSSHMAHAQTGSASRTLPSSPRTQREACAGCGSRNSSDTNGGAEADFGIKGAVSATTSPHFSIKKPGFSNSGETPSSLNQTGGSCLLNLNNPRRRLMHQPGG